MVRTYDRLFEPESKVGMLVSEGIFSFFKTSQNKSELPKTLANRFMVEMRVLEVQLNSKLFRVFDKKFQQFIEADLVGVYKREVDLLIGLSKIQVTEKENFKVLTLAELEAGFVVFLVPLAFSLVVFILEWITALAWNCFLHVVWRNFFPLES